MKTTVMKSPRELAGVRLVLAYALLKPANRKVFQDMLLQHVSPYASPDSYRRGGSGHRRKCWLELPKSLRVHPGKAWMRWASEIEDENPSVETARELIFDLLTRLARVAIIEENEACLLAS